jgi:hypothetical protein
VTVLETRLPRSVLREFNERVASEGYAADVVGRVYKEMNLRGKYRVSLEHTRSHVITLRKRAEREAVDIVAGEGVMDASLERRESWRMRLACAAEIARGINERLGAADMGGIQRAARLVLVSRIFDALTQDEAELPTAELSALTRAYVAQRKLADADADAAAASPHDRVNDEAALRTAVRQVYGLDMPDDAATNSS